IREEVAELPRSYTTPRLFVYGVLSVDDWIRVYVAQTIPYGKPDFQQKDFQVNEATVTLRDADGRKVTLVRNPDDPFVYQVGQRTFPIKTGQTYRLQVDAPGFTPVTATTTVPAERADWKRLSLTVANDGGYLVSGYWDALSADAQYGYGVIYSVNDRASIAHGNEGIARMDAGYSVKQQCVHGNQRCGTRVVAYA